MDKLLALANVLVVGPYALRAGARESGHWWRWSLYGLGALAIVAGVRQLRAGSSVGELGVPACCPNCGPFVDPRLCAPSSSASSASTPTAISSASVTSAPSSSAPSAASTGAAAAMRYRALCPGTGQYAEGYSYEDALRHCEARPPVQPTYEPQYIKAPVGSASLLPPAGVRQAIAPQPITPSVQFIGRDMTAPLAVQQAAAAPAASPATSPTSAPMSAPAADTEPAYEVVSAPSMAPPPAPLSSPPPIMPPSESAPVAAANLGAVLGQGSVYLLLAGIAYAALSGRGSARPAPRRRRDR